MAKNILVCSRLPHSLLIDHPTSGQRVEIKGLNSTQLIVPYVSTSVDEDFYSAWKSSMGTDFAPLKSGALFVAKSEADALAFTREIAAEKTGFEKANPESKDGVEAA